MRGVPSLRLYIDELMHITQGAQSLDNFYDCLFSADPIVSVGISRTAENTATAITDKTAKMIFIFFIRSPLTIISAVSISKKIPIMYNF